MQLAAVALVLLLLLVGAAFWLSDRLVRSELTQQASERVQNRADATAAVILDELSDSALLAEPLIAAFNAGIRDPELYDAVGINLLSAAHKRTSGRVVALGLWPAPGTWARGQERAAQHWIVSDDGVSRRDDFNDTRRIPYTGEIWYTLTQYAPPGRCTWTGRRSDPLIGSDVVTCTQPILRDGEWVGAATVDLALNRLPSALSQAHGDAPGYGILVDASGRLLATTDALAGADAVNLAGLSQQLPALSPLAVALHADEEQRVQQSIELDRYQAKTVSALRDATRDLARSEAESLLANLWTQGRRNGSARQVAIASDPIVGESALATVRDVGNTGWRYAAIAPDSAELGGATYIITQSLVVTSGLVAIAMLLLLGLVRLRVLNPLRSMVRTLQKSRSLEDALQATLDESSRNEIGELAHWLNHRSALLIEVTQEAQAVNTQLVLEVGERKNAVQSLAATRERAEMTLKCIADGVITTDRDGNIEFMNPVAESLVGRSNQESRGHTIANVMVLSSSSDHGDSENVVREAMTSGKRVRLADRTLRTLSGDTRRVALTVAPVRGRSGEIIGSVIAIHEHSEPSGGNAAPTADFSRDAMTGLFSRNMFDEDVAALIEQQAVDGGRHALLLIDVDQMRRINDKHGEAAGNEMLRHLAHLVGAEVGRDGRVYRLGGDKLLALLRDTTPEAAEDRGEAIRQAVTDTPFRWESQRLVPALSIGLVKIDPGAGTAMELLRRAESAVQSAKAVGGNCTRRYRVEERKATSGGSDDVWTSRVRTGLDEELFHLMSQVIEPLTPGLPAGVEIHVSLEDEEGFWASPTAFMPAATRAGLAPAIDRLVLQQMLDFATARTDDSDEQFYAVNLSAASLRDADFLDQALELISASNLPASRICFEIDETTAVRHRVETHEVLSALRPIGCRFVLDNFSSGMDGSELLKALRFDYVKLHQTLSGRAGGERIDRVALEAVIRVLRELDILVIAGRVDDPATRTPLTELGVDYIQGFAIGRPTPLMFDFATTDSED